MKAYRYMSIKEFLKMSAGVPMVHCGHFKAKTNSEGFCFLPKIIIAHSGKEKYTFSPEESIVFLHGIVTNDILVEFEITNDLLIESFGIYSNPFTYDYMSITEYCTKTYNREKFVPVRYAFVDFFGAEWYNFN